MVLQNSGRYSNMMVALKMKKMEITLHFVGGDDNLHIYYLKDATWEHTLSDNITKLCKLKNCLKVNTQKTTGWLGLLPPMILSLIHLFCNNYLLCPTTEIPHTNETSGKLYNRHLESAKYVLESKCLVSIMGESQASAKKSAKYFNWKKSKDRRSER
ncbi:hypothetical protein ACHAXS_013417 [Conticribra weissflogii]